MHYIDTRGKLFQHLDQLDALQHGRRVPPVNVEIDLSNRCSLGCVWCHFAHTHTRGPLANRRTVETGDLMDPALAFRLGVELQQAGVQSITWSGGGEPTLHPDFDRLIEACPLPQGLYTNGQQLTPFRSALLKRRCAWVYISLDAAFATDYALQKQIGPEKFDQVCEHIQALTASPGGATVGLGFLLDGHNWQAMPDMALLGQRLNVDYVQFRPRIDFDPQHPAARIGDLGWIDRLLQWFPTLTFPLRVEFDPARFAMLRDWQGHGYARCWWSGLQTVITPDGSVWTCLNKRGETGRAWGNLHVEPFAAIWSRARIAAVDARCRVMCRGHIANTTLDPVMTADLTHVEFI